MKRKQYISYAPNRSRRKKKRVSKKMMSTCTIIFVILLGFGVLFGGGDPSDNDAGKVATPSTSSVESSAEPTSEPSNTDAISPEEQSEYGVPPEPSSEAPADGSGIEATTDSPSTETLPDDGISATSDPAPQAPDSDPSPSSGSVDIDLNDSNNYSPSYSEPDTTRSTPSTGTDQQQIVYIYDTGTKYHHNSDCCGPDSHAISLEEAERLGYTPCKKKNDW